jgi:ATP-dependent Clp protease ATP-binding subunit ClpB
VQRLVAEKNIILEFTPEAKARLATIGYDPSYGARPLKRTIQKYVINTLSEKILSGEIGDGDTVTVGTDHRGMIEFVPKIKPQAVK